ncbi:MAG: hypothetical protein RLZZ69_3221, partial [Cyanobacteriota bacterium]
MFILQLKFKFNARNLKLLSIKRWLIGLLTFGLVIGLGILPVWTQQPIAIKTL